MTSSDGFLVIFPIGLQSRKITEIISLTFYSSALPFYLNSGKAFYAVAVVRMTSSLRSAAIPCSSGWTVRGTADWERMTIWIIRHLCFYYGPTKDAEVPSKSCTVNAPNVRKKWLPLLFHEFAARKWTTSWLKHNRSVHLLAIKNSGSRLLLGALGTLRSKYRSRSARIIIVMFDDRYEYHTRYLGSCRYKPQGYG